MCHARAAFCSTAASGCCLFAAPGCVWLLQPPLAPPSWAGKLKGFSAGNVLGLFIRDKSPGRPRTKVLVKKNRWWELSMRGCESSGTQVPSCQPELRVRKPWTWARAMLHWSPQLESYTLGTKLSVSRTVRGVPLSYTTKPAGLRESTQQMEGHGCRISCHNAACLELSVPDSSPSSPGALS